MKMYVRRSSLENNFIFLSQQIRKKKFSILFKTAYETRIRIDSCFRISWKQHSKIITILSFQSSISQQLTWKSFFRSCRWWNVFRSSSIFSIITTIHTGSWTALIFISSIGCSNWQTGSCKWISHHERNVTNDVYKQGKQHRLIFYSVMCFMSSLPVKTNKLRVNAVDCLIQNKNWKRSATLNKKSL